MASRANINCRDLRVQRTYKLLKDAFLRLLSEKPFEQITVQEICETAMVRRTTFYQHFEDKQDFLQWFVREKQREFTSGSSASEPDQTTTREHYFRLAHKVLAFLNENDHVLRLLISAGVQERMLIDAFSQACVEAIIRRIENIPNVKERLDGLPPSLIAEYYVGGMTAAAKWWFSNNKPCTEEELLLYLCKMIEEKNAI